MSTVLSRQATLPDLRSMTEAEMVEALTSMGEPSYRGRQLARWVHARGASSFAEMTDLPKTLRAELATRARLTRLEIRQRLTSPDGSTIKYLFACPDGSTVESVWMRYADGRRSVCVSTQVGCAMACAFCATGLAGLSRNLTAGEIVDQVYAMQRDQRERPTHVVFMGMGEPLANYGATVRAVRLLNAPYGLGIGIRRITVSTVGLVPQIRRLAQEGLDLNLAVSLHAPTDDLRARLVPIAGRYPLGELLEACRFYIARTRRRITFEYVLLAEVNDTLEEARALGRLLRGMLCHLNLIPWNPVPGLAFRRPPGERVREFARIVRAYGIPTTVRVERGTEIMAACGQLSQAGTPGRRPTRIRLQGEAARDAP
ncbi:MAG: 23S rRNA (adenine(2503)-C(2))-methyltransferase RlmN [Armatimonadota bacterium]|nr:23S rRNA (adenine(2503)-C(2))-methyltransferase RlmN [Armatimonadota bacterium]MDR7445362.1 23S rRNA (adenine(2503)-C(2))-methyltransferase RlmN [Armatimonadota bacterium]MDR7569750.1 23S rRNA (adenine(2503)-C(2))-methyltransferase RlmN [Armatimonadota bacterium]MDR7614096.1 23S rRNA (adenine(2503)-C(2))-methyltransferase RlmN [Armatimonadota bacterium]